MTNNTTSSIQKFAAPDGGILSPEMKQFFDDNGVLVSGRFCVQKSL
ncbi:hypothetical protein [Kiloniella litopenaei]